MNGSGCNRKIFHGAMWLCRGAIAAGCGSQQAIHYSSTEVANRLAERLPQVGGAFFRWRMRSVRLQRSWAPPGRQEVDDRYLWPGDQPDARKYRVCHWRRDTCVIVNVQRGLLPQECPRSEFRRYGQAKRVLMEITRSSPSVLLLLRRCSIIRSSPLITGEIPDAGLVLSDAFVGHMREEVVIPEPEKIKTEYRKIPEPGPTLKK